MVWIEYGLQSAHNTTLKRINRGHDRDCFEKAVYMTREYGIDTIAHVIIGLPGEDRKMIIETASYLSNLPLQGVKIHLLYVVEGTELANMYRRGEVKCLEMEEYVHLVVDFLEHLRPDIVIHRLTGDPPRGELIAPEWALRKTEVLNMIQQELLRRNTCQGKKYIAQK
jgi:radical SAM protein (TIGR01212 family)